MNRNSARTIGLTGSVTRSPPDEEDVVPEHLEHLVLVPALGDQGEVRHVHFKEHRLRLDLLHLERQNMCLKDLVGEF